MIKCLILLFSLLFQPIFADLGDPNSLVSVEGTKKTLGEAAKYCKDLNESGYTDWYLPTINELSAFSGDPNTNFLWTRTPYLNSNEGWITLRLSDGYLSVSKADSTKNVRCVRFD